MIELLIFGFYIIVGMLFFMLMEIHEFKKLKKEFPDSDDKALKRRMNDERFNVSLGTRFAFAVIMWPFGMIFIIGYVIASLLSDISLYFVKAKK